MYARDQDMALFARSSWTRCSNSHISKPWLYWLSSAGRRGFGIKKLQRQLSWSFRLSEGRCRHGGIRTFPGEEEKRSVCSMCKAHGR